ncbi:hypothetical protein Pint_10380 [Pistacia integerrima]|uniref:Uncharacterized protein n=1 Tax=Pistacia integerrima TaxID=434235 RepID=A0ACC0XEA7_9ROSI|nr:hypothetical protein Pint_10380 [Pistacia integerrima]
MVHLSGVFFYVDIRLSTILVYPTSLRTWQVRDRVVAIRIGREQCQQKTIKEEDKITTKLASLQEDMADQPISLIAKNLSGVGKPSEEVDRALDEHESAMANMIQEVDKLRLNTLKEFINILTPEQAVDFLASSKKLHLCVHEWGERRDRKSGRT